MQAPSEAGRAGVRAPSTRARPVDAKPLVILAAFLFVVLLVATIPTEDAFPVLYYLPTVFLLAQVTYARVIRPADRESPAAVFWLAFLLKLIGTVAYYWMIREVYGRGDANVYHFQARRVAEYLAQLDFSILREFSIGRQSSTNMVLVTSVLYTVLPAVRLGGGMVFSTLAFTGSAFFYRAFRVAFPDRDRRLYQLAVFFLPSILFWTSATGKDAWIFFGSGIVAYGLARYTRQAQPAGMAVAAVGLGIVYLGRPHFAAFMVLAAGSAFLLFYRVTSSRRLAVWLAGFAIIAFGGGFVLQSASEFLGLGTLSEVTFEEVEDVYEFRQLVSTGGGGGYATQGAISPVGLLSAPVTVLLRPFPWEAHNAQALVTSLESLAWLAVFWWRRRVLWEKVRSLRHDPWVAFNLGYAAIMVVALTTAGNFGIIARQRVALLPFLWLLFA